MPRTAWTMMAATLAISGVPLLSGFYSKDAILADAAHLAWIEPGSWPLFVMPAVGALLTAFYMFRMWFLMFDGDARSEAAERAEESPARLTVPLMILAVLSVVSGWPVTVLPLATPVLEGWLKAVEPLPAVDVSEVRYWAMGASVLVAAIGFALAMGFYSRWRLARPRPLGPIQSLLVNRWYFDRVYALMLVRPVMEVASWLPRFDRGVLDRVLNGSAGATRWVSRVGGFLDARLVDGVVNLGARTVYLFGDWSRRLQTGHLRSYLGFLALAVVAMFVGMFWWIG